MITSVYISNTYVSNKENYMELFAKAEKYLAEQGYVRVINSAKIKANLPANTSYKQYINISLELLKNCNYIYMLDGWEECEDAKLEYAYAETVGMDILYQTPLKKTEEKKYYWRLKGDIVNKYLNIRESNHQLELTGNTYENYSFSTKFTESEYKKLAKDYGFAEDMFEKEEIE